MKAVPVAQAARELGISRSTLSAWVRRGAPVALRGRRGRGRSSQFDVDALRAWHDGGSTAALRVFAAEAPELLAAAIDDAFRGASGAHKRVLAGEFGGAWIRCVTVLLDRLRRDDPTIPELNHDFPEKIIRLRDIFLDSGTVTANRSHRNPKNV